VVRQRTRLVRGGLDERLAVTGRGERDRPGAEDDQARRSQLHDEPPQARPERRPVGGFPPDHDLAGPGGEEAQPVVLRERVPRGVQDPNQRAGVDRGLGCEDEDRDWGHGPGV
jgi:hypothetical protein